MTEPRHDHPLHRGARAELLRSLLESIEAETGGLSGTPGGIDLSVDQCEALYLLAHRHYSAEDYPEARKLFALMATASPVDVRAHMGLAACLQMEQEHERAVRHYFLASLLDLTQPAPVIHSAECLLALGRTDEAMKALTLARSQAEACLEHHGLLPRIDGLKAAVAAGTPG